MNLPTRKSRTPDAASLCPGHQWDWKSDCKVCVDRGGVGRCVYVRQRRVGIVLQDMCPLEPIRKVN